jgi:glycosyltransferase involved in cell wall biosynthesis
MRIVIVADACDPPTNGVIRTLRALTAALEGMGHDVLMIRPPGFLSVPCPTQPDIRLALAPSRRLRRLIEDFAPDAVHIATEGPLGLAARRLCRRRGWPFTTMFTSKFAETIHARIRVPVGWTWAALRWFHAPATRTMAATESLAAELAARGFGPLARVTRGVDTELFRPRADATLPHPRPVWLYVGRVAPEKSVEDFLELELEGSKVVVGDGPDRERLERDHPDAVFLGTLRGEELARAYAAADVLVFPSRTDTFGLVVLEALASGTPVAAYPVTGPLDIIGDSGAGVLDEDLGRAARAALAIPRERARRHALGFSWQVVARQFVAALEPIARSAGSTMPAAPAAARRPASAGTPRAGG